MTPEDGAQELLDAHSRPLRDLRISVTDRCNFRCPYCMPRERFGRAHAFLPRADLLSFEEIHRVAQAFARLGVRKLRLTGGEPLLRADLPVLVRMLRGIPGVELALTTNGALLARSAEALAAAGLDRVTVSLDSLDPAVFRAMSDSDVPLTDVLAGIDAAKRVGLEPVKLNVVVRRSMNVGGIVEIARRFRGTGVVVRYIEYMDVGNSNGWQSQEVVPAQDVIERIDAVFPLEPLPVRFTGEVARRYRYRDGAGEVGAVASVTAPFCGDCSRARLSADGKLYTCLFATHGTDLRALLRSAEFAPESLESTLLRTWQQRADRYSEQRQLVPLRRKVEMSYIGG
jgi:cyclic pyranopterin phosphate synthase